MINPNEAWERLKSSVLSTQQVRQVDRDAVQRYGMHPLVLMENAALECVHWITGNLPPRLRTVVLCGRGNNGGDGLVIARHLRVLGWPCKVFVLGPLQGLSVEAAANFKILTSHNLQSEVVVIEENTDSERLREGLRNSEIVCDAMLGTGATGDPRTPISQWIDWANESAAIRLAIDLPTGVDAESGRVSPCHFRADHTLTFVAMKPAMAAAQRAAAFGEISVLPIGIPEQLIREILDQLSGADVGAS